MLRSRCNQWRVLSCCRIAARVYLLTNELAVDVNFIPVQFCAFMDYLNVTLRDEQWWSLSRDDVWAWLECCYVNNFTFNNNTVIDTWFIKLAIWMLTNKFVLFCSRTEYSLTSFSRFPKQQSWINRGSQDLPPNILASWLVFGAPVNLL